MSMVRVVSGSPLLLSTWFKWPFFHKGHILFLYCYCRFNRGSSLFVVGFFLWDLQSFSYSMRIISSLYAYCIRSINVMHPKIRSMLNRVPKVRTMCETRSKFYSVKTSFQSKKPRHTILNSRIFPKNSPREHSRPNYTRNSKRDAHCEFPQYRTTVKCSKLREI